MDAYARYSVSSRRARIGARGLSVSRDLRGALFADAVERQRGRIIHPLRHGIDDGAGFHRVGIVDCRHDVRSHLRDVELI